MFSVQAITRTRVLAIPVEPTVALYTRANTPCEFCLYDGSLAGTVGTLRRIYCMSTGMMQVYTIFLGTCTTILGKEGSITGIHIGSEYCTLHRTHRQSVFVQHGDTGTRTVLYRYSTSIY